MRFIPNPRVLAALATDEALLGKQLAEKGDDLLERARANAPVDTGEYRDALKSEVLVEDGMVRARVSTEDDEGKVLAIEYGTASRTARAPLRKALNG